MKPGSRCTDGTEYSVGLSLLPLGPPLGGPFSHHFPTSVASLKCIAPDGLSDCPGGAVLRAVRRLLCRGRYSPLREAACSSGLFGATSRIGSLAGAWTTRAVPKVESRHGSRAHSTRAATPISTAALAGAEGRPGKGGHREGNGRPGQHPAAVRSQRQAADSGVRRDSVPRSSQWLGSSAPAPVRPAGQVTAQAAGHQRRGHGRDEPGARRDLPEHRECGDHPDAGGGPYQRKVVVFQRDGSGGVNANEVVQDTRPGTRSTTRAIPMRTRTGSCSVPTSTSTPKSSTS